MINNDLHRRLPPPPLFTIRPPPKPPGSLFEHFQTVEIINGQCILPSLNHTSTFLHKHEQNINWINVFLLILALISVISCIIIAICIFICLKKLKNEEKQYKNYVITGSLSRNPPPHHHSNPCPRINEHYQCTSTTLNCCDDYYSHQLIPLNEASSSSVISPHHIRNSTNNIDTSVSINNAGGLDCLQNHQYECIPEYLLTMNRRHHPPSMGCQQHPLYHRPNTYSIPYATFSRSLILSQGVTTTTSTSDSSQCTCSPLPSTTIVQEESSTPLLAPPIHRDSHQTEETLVPSTNSRKIGWKKRTCSITTKKKSTGTNSNEQRYSFLSQLRKSSVLK